MSALPSGWTEITLGEIAAPSRRGIDPRNFPEEIFDLYSVPAYDAQRPDRVSGHEIGSAKQLVQPGDVLISKIVPHIRRVWVVPQGDDHRQIASGEWITYRSDAVDSSYLRHFLLSDPFHHRFMQTTAGVGGSLTRARPRDVARLRVPLPPLPEQRRIAAILNHASTLTSKADSLYELHSRVLKAAFSAVSTDSPQLPLSEVSDAIIDCPHSTPKWQETGVTCLRTTNLGPGHWVWDDHRFVSPSEHTHRTRRARLEPDDLVLSREGTLGGVALVPEGMEASLGQRLVQVRPGDPVEPSYLLHALVHELQPHRIENKMIGATAKRINVKQLKSLPVPVPPIEEQRKFAAIARKVALLREQAETKSYRLKGMTQALQSRAFRGEL